MAKTLKFPLTIFLFLALAYIIPPDGVSDPTYITWSCRKVECLKCYDCGDIASCNKLQMEDCKPDETICHVTELPVGTVIDRCCEVGSSKQKPGTCSGSGSGADPKECFCHTDLCNFNSTTASVGILQPPISIISFGSILFISSSSFGNI